MDRELVKVFSGSVIYVDRVSKQVVVEKIDKEARMVLDWYDKMVPANKI
jgi:hypothetical protein